MTRHALRSRFRLRLCWYFGCFQVRERLKRLFSGLELRKRARDGTLPPALATWISGLDMFLLLDGHDRRKAALLEGKAPPLLVLWHIHACPRAMNTQRQVAVLAEIERQRIRGRGQLGTETENALLLDAFDSRDVLRPTTRAWPLAGGLAPWEQEVSERGVPRTHGLFSGDAPPGCD